jgi:hypothetical protein
VVRADGDLRAAAAHPMPLAVSMIGAALGMTSSVLQVQTQQRR